MNEINIYKTSSLNRLLALSAAGTSFVAIVFLKEINPTKASWLPPCPFHALTGLNCPGCGATRGMHALLNGDVLTALHYNALLVIFVPLMIYGFLALLSIAVRGRSLSFPRYSPQLTWILLVVMLIFGVTRNLPFYPFNLLAI